MSAAPETLCITAGSFVQNSWLVWDPASRAAVVVDPGEGHDLILAEAGQRGLAIEAIWLTHAHIDHILGVEAVREATGAPVWLHPDDRRWYDALPEQGRFFGIEGLPRLAPPEHELVAGATVHCGSLRFEIRHTPGHAPGHVALVGHGMVISGDVLFRDSIGRTDLAGADLATLMESIRRELLTLPDDTRVLPGHGPETTIGRERAENPFLRGG
ncbi:MAG: MBL fold metallo-hydrolase [Gemmatimonadales bacterium]|nr:MBL fold metallo-hydrolase [Gemmatimonadales bacterium]MDZ4389880.1 MBL fold metallo-hydrolase [Gemmatimonadales bacterium]